MIAASWHYWLRWPDHGGYNFVSGPLGQVTLLTGVLSFLGLWWHKHNCHVHHCWHLAWHVHPDHGHPVCKTHHPHRVHADGSMSRRHKEAT